MPYYAGKGQGRRAFQRHDRIYPPENRKRILIFARLSEQEAVETEKELIRNWGRIDLNTGFLRNLTAGGDGVRDWKPSSLTRQRMSQASKGKKKSKNHARKIGDFHRGRKRSQETCQRIGASKKGRILSTQHRLKISESLKGNNHALGFKHSEETRHKISEAGKGRKLIFTAEHCLHISEAKIGKRKGIPWSPARRTAESRKLHAKSIIHS